MKTFYFAYRIEKEAGMAINIATGEATESYMKVKLDVGQDDVSEDTCEKYHKDLCRSLGIDPQFLTQISMDQYLKETEDTEK